MAYPYMSGVPSGIPPPPPPPVVPYMGDIVYEIAVPPSPTGSPPGRSSRTPHVVYGSDDRGKGYDDERASRLAVGRSSSVKDYRRGASVSVGESRRRESSRPRSYYDGGRYDDDHEKRYYPRGRSYYADSDYSGGSNDSRERDHSRGPSRQRHYRSPSTHSDYEYAPYPPHGPPPGAWHPGPPPPPGPMGMPNMQMAMMANAPPPPPPPPGSRAVIQPGSMIPWQPPPPPNPNDELAEKIKQLQLELEESKKESEKIKKAKEAEEARKKKEEELREAVQKHLEAEEKAKREADKRAAEEEARVRAKAKQLIEEERRQQEVHMAEMARKKAELDAEAEKLAAEKLAAKEKMTLDLRKPTHTKFSKTHLCKEALDERKISYTEHEDSFLVHRWVDREEQNALWARTKEIRAYQLEYQRRFKEEADKAPVIDTPNGPVKIVKVGNNPPVTVPVVLVTKKAPVAEEPKFRSIFGLR